MVSNTLKHLRWDCSCCRTKYVFPPSISDEVPATPPNSAVDDRTDFFIAAYGLSNFNLGGGATPGTPAYELERPELYFSSTPTFCYVSARFNNFNCTRCQTYNEAVTPADQQVSFYAICSQKCLDKAVNTQTSPISLGASFRCKGCNATQIPSVRVIPINDAKAKKSLDAKLKSKASRLLALRNEGKISAKTRFDHSLIKTRPVVSRTPTA